MGIDVRCEQLDCRFHDDAWGCEQDSITINISRHCSTYVEATYNQEDEKENV